jgi:hypothetical protein
VSKVEALLQAATPGLSKEEVLAMVGRAAKPLVQRKLEEVGVLEATQTRLVVLASQSPWEPDQAKAVFAAALPLVQAKPTVAAVEALLLAVLRLDPENKGIGDQELRAQAMVVIAEAVDPLVGGMPSVLGVPEATQSRLAVLASQSASEPEQAKDENLLTEVERLNAVIIPAAMVAAGGGAAALQRVSAIMPNTLMLIYVLFLIIFFFESYSAHLFSFDTSQILFTEEQHEEEEEEEAGCCRHWR